MNKLDKWLIFGWVIFIIFAITDICLNINGIYISNTLEVLVGTVFGAFETVCCTCIKTAETKASYEYQKEQLKMQYDYQDKQMQMSKGDKNEYGMERNH